MRFVEADRFTDFGEVDGGLEAGFGAGAVGHMVALAGGLLVRVAAGEF